MNQNPSAENDSIYTSDRISKTIARSSPRNQNYIRQITAKFKNRNAFREKFLHDPPYGGLIISTADSVQEGEEVVICVKLIQEDQQEIIRGVILWCRNKALSPTKTKSSPRKKTTTIAGVGLFSSELEPRDRLLKAEERQDRRFSASCKVIYQTGPISYTEFTKNISAGGLLLQSQQTLTIGTKILIKLFPPHQGTPIELAGEVVRKSPSGGYGVRFINPAPSTRRRIEQIVGSMPEC